MTEGSLSRGPPTNCWPAGDYSMNYSTRKKQSPRAKRLPRVHRKWLAWPAWPAAPQVVENLMRFSFPALFWRGPALRPLLCGLNGLRAGRLQELVMTRLPEIVRKKWETISLIRDG